jgi:hypothetical protein
MSPTSGSSITDVLPALTWFEVSGGVEKEKKKKKSTTKEEKESEMWRRPLHIHAAHGASAGTVQPHAERLQRI